MKKTLNVLLVALTVIALAVSCSPSALDDDVKGVVSFSIEEPKSVSTEVLTYQFSDIVWYFSAHKADSSLWKTGATTDLIDLATKTTSGALKSELFKDSLDFGEPMTFSKGSWNMAIQGRLADGTVVYQSASKAVNVIADKETTVDFAVDNVLPKGQIILAAIYANFGVAAGDPPVNPYDSTELEIEALVDGGALTLSGEGEKGAYDFTYSKVDKEIVSTGEHVAYFFMDQDNMAAFELEDGIHSLTLNVYPKGATHSAENIASTGSVTFVIYHGYNVLISGDLTNLDETGTVVVEQNVAKVGSTFYKSLEAAFAAANNGDKIELLSDIKLKKVIEISGTELEGEKKLTLDLSYFNIESSVSPVFKITNGAELTVIGGKDSEIKTTAVGGDAIIINGCGVTQKSGKISSIDCQKGHYDLEGGEVATIKVAAGQNVKLAGGEVTSKVEAEKGALIELGNVAISATVESASTIENATVTFTAGTVSPGAIKYAVARIGNKYYQSLAGAIDAVGDNETIVMLKDVNDANGISVPSGKNFTVDFNQKTYVCFDIPAGSTDTKNQVFQLLRDSTIKFKNGKISVASENSSKFKFIIQNYANLTLEGMELDGANLKLAGKSHYVISNNFGNTELKNTKITAADGDFAFDAYYFNEQGYTTPPNVIVSGNSEITGKVEASGGTIDIQSGTVNGMVRVGENSGSGNEYKGKTGSVVTIGKEATVNGTVVVFGPQELNIYGSVSGYVLTNGNAYNAGSVINIFGGATIDAGEGIDVPVYIPNGTLNVSGGTITGDTAVYFKSTNINISGGTFIATGAKEGYDYSGDGCNATGDALVIDSCNYPNGIESVSVSGGNFSSAHGEAVTSFTSHDGNQITGFITGGTFSSNPGELIATGYAATQNDTGWVVSAK